MASALTTATQKLDDRSQSSVQVSLPETHVSLPARGGPETRDGDDKTSSACVNSHKSETSSKIVAGDKTTKENKCSSENLEILISKKKGDCDDVAKVSNKILIENNCQGKKSSSSSSRELSLVKNNGTKNISSSKQQQQPASNETRREEKIKSKKRRRKTNKTGFPCKIKKKKKLLHNSEMEDVNSNTEVVEHELKPDGDNNLLPSAVTTATSAFNAKSRGGFFDNLETFKISSANILETAGRPKRECRVQEKEESEENEASTSKENQTSSKGMKRTRSPERSREKRTKRSRPHTSQHSPFKRTSSKNSSSIDPSPCSSDVESVDFRSYLDDDGDVDYLHSTLPSMEDNLLSPSVAESSEHQADEKRKKSKTSNINITKKNFLKAGLFSYDFKTGKAAGGRGSGAGVDNNLIKTKGIMYKPEEHPFSLLPPPYYCGRQLRQKKEDFALPFDLWSLHSTNSLPNRDIIATWNYKRIKSNIYIDVKSTPNFDTPACHCKPPTDPNKPYCGNKCLNRMTFTECDPDNCPLEDKCSNMVIQKHHSSVQVQRFMTNEKGWGIRARSAVTPGTFIMEYLGEVVTDKEFKRRMQTDYQKDSHHYCLHVGEGLVIDGYRMGGECRFVNHSCAPNCEMQKWSVNGMWRMALFSKVAIDVNEELTYDYNFSWFNTHEGQACHCGSEECRGVIGGKGKKVAAGQKLSGTKTGKCNKENSSKSSNSKLSDSSQQQKDAKLTKHQSNAKLQESGKSKTNVELLNRSNLNHFAPLKPMTGAQQQFCRSHSVLLLRNLEKIRKLRDLYFNKVTSSNNTKPIKKTPIIQSSQQSSVEHVEQKDNNSVDQEVLKAGLIALPSARSVQTRRLAPVQENPDVAKVTRISKIFLQILDQLNVITNDVDGASLMKEFMSLPSKEELPQYHSKISEPIDFTSIQTGLGSGSYHSVVQIDQEILLLFQNNIRFYGSGHPSGKNANHLRTKYNELCTQHYDGLMDIVGEENVRCLRRPAPMVTDEDVINCACDQLKDEGVMVQCDQCNCWQHTDCVLGYDGGDDNTLLPDNWLCDLCCPDGDLVRTRDIALVPQPEFAGTGETYYVAMMREDGMKMVLGMTVYVLRAFKDRQKDGDGGVDEVGGTDQKITVGHGGVPHKSISPIKGPSKEAASLLAGNYPTYKTVVADGSQVSTQDMDIFRVERLWVNEAGKKFAFGYHYLRPHETFHEPSRKFYDNEVFRVPLYEVLPLDTIWSQCWVMDPTTFCRSDIFWLLNIFHCT